MKLHVFNLAAVVSGFICIAITGWWIRSYRTQDFVAWCDTTVDGPQAWSDKTWGVGSYCGELAFYRSEDSAWYQGRDETTGRRLKWHPYTVVNSTQGWFPRRFGPRDYEYRASQGKAKYTGFDVPHWVLAGLAGIMPLLRAARWLRGCRARVGACHSCGYDLRATPDRCPECGTVPDSA